MDGSGRRPVQRDLPTRCIPGRVYTYTVTGQAPCTPAVATVTVTVNTALTPGTTHPSASVPMMHPDLFASWAAPRCRRELDSPGGSSSFGLLRSGADGPGAYTYTVTGLAPCDDASAVVTVSEVEAPDAGTSVVISVCSNDGSFSLLGQLGGTPITPEAGPLPGGGAFGDLRSRYQPDRSVHRTPFPALPPCSNAVSHRGCVGRSSPGRGHQWEPVDLQ